MEAECVVNSILDSLHLSSLRPVSLLQDSIHLDSLHPFLSHAANLTVVISPLSIHRVFSLLVVLLTVALLQVVLLSPVFRLLSSLALMAKAAVANITSPDLLRPFLFHAANLTVGIFPPSIRQVVSLRAASPHRAAILHRVAILQRVAILRKAATPVLLRAVSRLSTALAETACVARG